MDLYVQIPAPDARQAPVCNTGPYTVVVWLLQPDSYEHSPKTAKKGHFWPIFGPYISSFLRNTYWAPFLLQTARTTAPTRK